MAVTVFTVPRIFSQGTFFFHVYGKQREIRVLKNPEEGISYSLITSVYFPLLLKELDHKKEKKKLRKN